MVFESLINPLKAEKEPWKMFFIGLIYSSVAVLLSLFIFRDYASLVMIFLAVLASVHIIYAAIKMEEKKSMLGMEEKILIKEHGRVLLFLVFLFLGFVVSFSLWYVFLPSGMTDTLFRTQINEINHVDISIDSVTGDSISTVSVLSKIFLNNLWVMVFSLLFAFFYGVGAIFILTWNASVIGAAIGIFAENTFSGSYVTAISMGLLRYSVHGIPEMLAYFTAGLAGSIISVAVIRHDFGSGKFRHILIDSIDLILLSIVILFIAGLLEVFVTPMFF